MTTCFHDHVHATTTATIPTCNLIASPDRQTRIVVAGRLNSGDWMDGGEKSPNQHLARALSTYVYHTLSVLDTEHQYHYYYLLPIYNMLEIQSY
ncbi:uncharacterized protein LACBIDRAFT_301598 [Laccaria bicolor S238N-H82]|uniref:Predicted protein n=1 Tax=Laccaria bicolor (strain S238N-H82 / ATCC MYA-4686) TaxID=486041 RepID=B0CNW2_LACBS|nr:uncharacterized protein LACBIDRAFT_301598 [Laccaria bicolor S238N-H82]EDR15361.1 predicted protein [Laccaria bicolor S238N-H82]|eukprot:XP_001873569.1 predicted protein [Laccaria bicolor S238N-H82]